MLANCNTSVKYYLSLILVSILSLPLSAQVTQMKSDNYSDSISLSSKQWFDVKEIMDDVWRISDNGHDNTYLVIGSKKALLIDTGIGSADLKSVVETLTNRPLIIVNTHGHPDHCGSNYQFDTVYASAKDFEMIAFFNTRHYHSGTIESTKKESPEYSDFIVDDVDGMRQAVLKPVEEGYIFDLGNRNLKVVEVPGHTQGCICLLDVNFYRR